MILLIDNYDSFVYNLARYFSLLGQETVVVRNDAIDLRSVRELSPDAVVMSPGPCSPQEAGCCLEVVHELHKELPMLGVCLGHQVIAEALGGTIVRAAEPRHGRTSEIVHHGAGIFAGLPSPLTVCRYHSLIVDPESFPKALRATAHTEDGTIMALEHTRLPVFGVQFHPEAILTEGGYQLLANFLRAAGIDATVFSQDGSDSCEAAPGQAVPGQDGRAIAERSWVGLEALEYRSPAPIPLAPITRPVTF